MLGSNPSACQVSVKGRGEVAKRLPHSVFTNPFGETKAVNPGGLGAEPPNRSFNSSNYSFVINYFAPANDQLR